MVPFCAILYAVNVGQKSILLIQGKERFANRQITRVNKVKKQKAVHALPTPDELRAALKKTTSSDAYQIIRALFDDNTFVETSAYVKRTFSPYAESDMDSEFEGVITGYGAIDGNLVCAFVQDASRMKGAIDANHAKKIESLYRLALTKSAPVIGVFASSGAMVQDGISSLSAYAKIMKIVTEASDEIPQIAYIYGNCIGTCAGIASCFDFVIANNDAKFYVNNPEIGGALAGNDCACYRGDHSQCLGYIRSLINYLPLSMEDTIETADDMNRRLGNIDWRGDANILLGQVCDGGQFLPLYTDTDDGVVVALSSVAGVRTGFVAVSHMKDNGKLNTSAIRKITEFLNICEAYHIPVVTLNDSQGISTEVTPLDIRDLAFAYAGLTVPAVTVICGHAIGAAYVLLGSKALGTDLVYSISDAEIGPMSAAASVAFCWNDQITTSTSREELEARWRETVSTPLQAASTGEIDDIIDVTELRAYIASALLMLSC